MTVRVEMNEHAIEDLASRLHTLSVDVEMIGVALHRFDRTAWPSEEADDTSRQIRTILELSEQIDRASSVLRAGLERQRALEREFAAECDILGDRFQNMALEVQALNTRFASQMDRASRQAWQRSAQVESMFVPSAGQACLVPALSVPVRSVVDWPGEKKP